MTWPTMSGRPALSCVACQSRVMVPALPTCVLVSAWAGAVHGMQARSSAPITAKVFIWLPPRPLEVRGGGKGSPRGELYARERTLAQGGAGRDAAGNQASVARDLAEVVQDGQERA